MFAVLAMSYAGWHGSGGLMERRNIIWLLLSSVAVGLQWPVQVSVSAVLLVTAGLAGSLAL